MKARPITVRPAMGGRLMSAISSENATIANYDIKRNVRRYADREIRSEGHVLFCPKVYLNDEDVAYIPELPTSDPITLVVMLRHPNGRTMVIAGTATTLWRYYGIENPLYVADGYVADGYVDSESVAWKQIGSGFSASGRRWECETVNGYLVLNNGVDLPMTYRLTDDSVTPIHELRELGVASVGTIVIQNSHLLCMDIRQIKEDKFLEIMTPIDVGNVGQSGVALAGVKAKINSGVDGVSGNTITAESSDFNSGDGFVGMEGRSIRMLNGQSGIVESVTSATVATLAGSASLAEPYMDFYLPTDQSNFSIGANTIMDELDFSKIGLNLWWSTGERRTITGLLGENYLVNSDGSISSSSCVLENPAAYARFDDEAFIDRYQNRVIHSLPDNPRRFGSVIPGSINPLSNTIVLDYPIKSIGIEGGEVTLTGMLSGNLTATGLFFNGIQMFIGSNAIKNFYSAEIDSLDSVEADVEFANTVLESVNSTLLAAQDALTKANESAAADANDADLSKAAADASAAVDDVLAAKSQAEKDLEAANTALTEAQSKSIEAEDIEFQLSDSLSDVSRLEDLQNDGSAILKAVSMDSLLVIFTETAIFLARYVASIGTFTYQLKEIQKNMALFYRNTAVLVDSEFIMYAAENQFCRFDLTTQRPVGIPLMRDCQDIFFDQADPDETERIFAVNNGVTSEIIICFPSDGDDKTLRLEYEFKTVSTGTFPMTAGANVIFPGTNQTVFVMGGAGGKVLRYGLVAGGNKRQTGTAAKSGNVVAAASDTFLPIHAGQTIRFSNGKRFGIAQVNSPTQVLVVGSGNVSASAFYIEPACWHMLGVGYKSVIQSCCDAFKSVSALKKLPRWSLMLSSFSPDSPISVTFRSGMNANMIEDRITASVTPPHTLVAPLLEDYLISDRIEIDGVNNPLELTSRDYHISGAGAASFGRRIPDA